MKKYIELIYRIIFIIIGGICVGIHFNINNRYYNMHSFSYFTVQSNILCLVVMCILLIKYLQHKDIYSRGLIYFKGMAMSSILCAFLIYHFGECRIKYPLSSIGIFGLPLTTLLSHYIIPFMFLLDWILFQPKGFFKWWHIGGWLAFPLTYFLGFISRCFLNSNSAFIYVEKFPYYFLDYETLGVRQFTRYIFIISLIIAVENLFIVIADKVMTKWSSRPK